MLEHKVFMLRNMLTFQVSSFPESQAFVTQKGTILGHFSDHDVMRERGSFFARDQSHLCNVP